jgi:hypothetical protein
LKELEFSQYSRRLLKENIVQEKKNIVFKKNVLGKSRVATYKLSYPFRFYSMPARFSEGQKKDKKSKLTSCPVWLP